MSAWFVGEGLADFADGLEGLAERSIAVSGGDGDAEELWAILLEDGEALGVVGGDAGLVESPFDLVGVEAGVWEGEASEEGMGEGGVGEFGEDAVEDGVGLAGESPFLAEDL